LRSFDAIIFTEWNLIDFEPVRKVTGNTFGI
jgi:hypothetical protein